MAVRIYTLAKEFKLDSKDLVDICTRVGIPGKGSALASLTDEEVARVREHLSGGGRPSKKAAGRVAVGAPVEQGVVRREDYIAPGGSVGKPAVLDVKSKKAADKPKEAAPDAPKPAKLPPRPAPVVKLAPLPPADLSKTPPKSNEPAPQKPDLKLPADAIRAGKAGARPLAEHLRKHEQKRRDEEKDAEKGRPRRGGQPAAPAAPPIGTEARGKRTTRGKGDGKTTEAEGPDGRPLLGGREQRQLDRKRSRVRRSDDDETTISRPRKSIKRTRSRAATATIPRKGRLVVEFPCTIRGFSEATGVPSASILRVLLDEGSMANVNSPLDFETAELIVADLGLEVEWKRPVDLETQLVSAIRDREDAPEELETRPPVITFLGHVDHGKTSLLDRILHLDVVSGESGGITQHIRAYEIDKDGRKIAFVDTPGHEAFTEMRARGANVTDIAVLVVAADDGVMPQTEEAISHARAAEVPIVVALNKMDLPGADTNKAYQQLAAAELLPSEWGGDVEVIKTSAVTGAGIDELLETLLTVAELHDYKANPRRAAFGTCLEAQQEAGRGVVAKLIVQNGTLRVGDVVVCGQAFGRVKAMYDTLKANRKLDEAGPSTPVNVTGFDEAPAAGEAFYVVPDIAQAREIAEQRATATRARSLGGGPVHVTLENLFDRLGGDGQVQTLNIILRADVRGSIEAIQKELTKLEHPEVKIKVLQATVGGITEADVHLADASDAVIIGFNVVPEEGARSLADRRGVQIRRYDIIYKVTEDLKAALEGMLKPEEREVELGRTLVQRTFTISRVGTIAGCRVLAGTIERNCRVRVIRNSTIIGDYKLASLRREKDDTKEVREGMECGMKLDGFNDLKEGDILEAYKIEEVGRTFD